MLLIAWCLIGVLLALLRFVRVLVVLITLPTLLMILIRLRPLMIILWGLIMMPDLLILLFLVFVMNDLSDDRDAQNGSNGARSVLVTSMSRHRPECRDCNGSGRDGGNELAVHGFDPFVLGEQAVLMPPNWSGPRKSGNNAPLLSDISGYMLGQILNSAAVRRTDRA